MPFKLQLVHCHGIVAGVSLWAMYRTFYNEQYLATSAFAIILSKSTFGILNLYFPSSARKKADEVLTYAAHMFTVPLINAQFCYPEYKFFAVAHILSAAIPTAIYGTSGVTPAGTKYVDLVTMANIFSLMKFSEAMDVPEGILLGALCIIQFFALGLVSRFTHVQWLYLYTLGFCLIDLTTIHSINIFHPLIMEGVQEATETITAVTGDHLNTGIAAGVTTAVENVQAVLNVVEVVGTAPTTPEL